MSQFFTEGRWADITNAEHHSGKYITSTRLKAATKTGVDYLHALAGVADTDAMRIGRVTHSYVLEGVVPTLCPLKEDGTRLEKRSNADKATWAEFEGRMALAGQDWVTPDELETIREIRSTVLGDFLAASTLTGIAEVSGIAMSPLGLVAIRPDIRSESHIADLKTCADASPAAVQRAIITNGYALQAAFYVDVAEAIDGFKREFFWGFVERDKPRRVQVYHATADLIEYGRRKYQDSFRNIERWVGDNNFPATFAPFPIDVEVPRWAE